MSNYFLSTFVNSYIGNWARSFELCILQTVLMPMSTTKLVIDYEYEFDLYGVVAPIKEYKLAWLLNRGFGWDLTKSKDIEVDFLNDGMMIISNYSQENDFSFYRLLKNQCSETKKIKAPYLLPEIKQFDFVLQLEGEILYKLEEADVLEKLRNISGIHFATKIDVENLKSKDNLLI